VRRTGAFARRVGRGSLTMALVKPRRVLLIGALLATLGWVADTQTEVVSDVRDLVPSNFQALKDAKTLQDTTNVSGEIDVMVTAKDLTDPSVIGWMVKFQQGALCAHGYQTKTNCATGKPPAGYKGPPELYPALSLPDLFRSTDITKKAQVQGLLKAVPPYFSQAVISSDRRTANLAFGIRLMPLERQKRVIDDLRDRLQPPAGVSAQLAGLPVLAADANHELSSTSRRALTTLAGLIAVFLVLFLIRRRLREAAVPLIPIALATGWSSALLFLLRIPLNPMSAALGALVIAISTEFSVLLSARYRDERAAGWSPRSALERTYASTGAAVLASGTTAIAGFAALIASDIRMLRDFGIVTVVDLTVSLLGVMVVLPAALMWAEQHGPFSLRDLHPRRLLARPGRRATASG
jgi:predicted RND superfamily exporter protein